MHAGSVFGEVACDWREIGTLFSAVRSVAKFIAMFAILLIFHGNFNWPLRQSGSPAPLGAP